MLINYCEQGTPEWYAARRGLATASEFDKIITSKGAASKQRTAYLHKLAGAYFAGEEAGYENEWMKRGKEMEAEAVALYEFETGNEAHAVGLVYKAGLEGVSCSPDSLIETGSELGGLEVKCPAPHTHVEYVMGGKLPGKYFHQVQGSMWVTGLPWWDFISYHPNMRPLIVRATPDPDYFAALDTAVPKFLDDLSAIIEQVGGAKHCADQAA